MSRLSSFTGKNFENYTDGGVTSNKFLNFADNLNVIYVPSSAVISSYSVNNFPVFDGFDRKVITFTLIKNQPTLPLAPTLPNSFILNGSNGSTRGFSSAQILWLDGVAPAPQAGVTQFINFIVVNTATANPSGASLNQYTVYGNLNGPYS
jgi:hypothetical protein